MCHSVGMHHILAIMSMIFLAFPLCPEAFCSPPPSVLCKGNGGECQIFNYQGIWEDRSICRAAEAASPRTEAEILHAVAGAVKNKQKIKVISTLAHSLSKLACVGDHGLIISTENYASVIGINKTAMTITVEGGALMRDVIEEAAKEGLALHDMIYWNGVSAAGVVSTGAHGSGLMGKGKGSGVYEYVVGMRLVVPASPSEGYAKLISLTEPGKEDLKAARLSLGTLGVISQLTFSLEPMFKRSLTTPILTDDKGLDKEAARFLKSDYEFANLIWFPFHRLVLFRPFDRVPIEAPGEGLSIPTLPSSVADIENSDAQFSILQSTEDYAGLCSYFGEQIISFVANGSGFWNDRIKGFTGYPVTGFNHRMQSTGGCEGSYRDHQQNMGLGCTSTEILDKNQTVCAWDRRVPISFTFDVELRVPLSRLPEVINDIKKIRDLNPQSMCEIYPVFRSIKKSEAYLGPAEDVVTLELEYYRPREPKSPKWNEDVYEEIEQMVIEKHGGTLHWGQSGGYLFGGLAKRAVNLEKFLQVKNRYDPEGLFSNEWTDGLLGIGGKGVEELRDGCALDKMCKCREDKHCAPEKGSFCRPGRIWKQARVCRKLD